MTNILDIDWEHELFEPVSKHNKYHPVGGEPPVVRNPKDVLDIDVHPNRESAFEAGDEEAMKYLDVPAEANITFTPEEDQQLAELNERINKLAHQLKVDETKKKVLDLEVNKKAVENALEASR